MQRLKIMAMAILLIAALASVARATILIARERRRKSRLSRDV